MSKVLLLGGSQHLCTFPVGSDFGTPISHCNGVDQPEQYHRTVFYPSDADAAVANVWYVYVTDDYQSQPDQLTNAMVIDELKKREISPHIISVDVRHLQLEHRLNSD